MGASWASFDVIPLGKWVNLFSGCLSLGHFVLSINLVLSQIKHLCVLLRARHGGDELRIVEHRRCLVVPVSVYVL